MRRPLLLLVLLFASLPGCVTKALWSGSLGNRIEVTVEDAEYSVDTAGWQQDVEGGAPASLLVQARQRQGRLVRGLDRHVSARPWFELSPQQAADGQVAQLVFVDQLLGPVERVGFEIEWRADENQTDWTAQLRLGGDLAPSLRQPVGLDGVPALEAGARVLAPAAAAIADLDACIAAVEAFDWRLLAPSLRDGRGRVEAVLAPSGEGPPPTLQQLDLLVALEELPPHHYLRLPATAMAALCVAVIDAGRFEVESAWRPRVVPGPGRSMRPLSLPPDTVLQLHSILRREVTDTGGVFAKVLLTPVAFAADLAIAGFLAWLEIDCDDIDCDDDEDW